MCSTILDLYLLCFLSLLFCFNSLECGLWNFGSIPDSPLPNFPHYIYGLVGGCCRRIVKLLASIQVLSSLWVCWAAMQLSDLFCLGSSCWNLGFYLPALSNFPSPWATQKRLADIFWVVANLDFLSVLRRSCSVWSCLFFPTVLLSLHAFFHWSLFFHLFKRKWEKNERTHWLSILPLAVELRLHWKNCFQD